MVQCMIRFTVLLAVMVWGAIASPQASAQIKSDAARERNVFEFATIQWQHFTNPNPTLKVLSLNRLDVDVTIIQEFADESDYHVDLINLAPTKENSTLALSTSRSTNDTTNTLPNARRIQGPAFEFFRWASTNPSEIRSSVTDGKLAIDEIVPTKNGTPPRELKVIQANRPFLWKKGKYTISVIATDSEVRNNVRRPWYACYIYNHESAETTYAGSLLYEERGLVALEQVIATSLRIYNRKNLKDWAMDRAGYFSFAVGNIRYNGKPFQPYAIVLQPLSDPLPISATVEMAEDHVKRCPQNKAILGESLMTVVFTMIPEQPKFPQGQVLYKTPDAKLGAVALTDDQQVEDYFRRARQNEIKPVGAQEPGKP
jgi:hypothetical protein